VASAGVLDYMQIIWTSLQTDNHTNTSSLNFFTGRMLFLTPNQQCQSTEGSNNNNSRCIAVKMMINNNNNIQICIAP